MIRDKEHGEINELGNEGENISKILEKEEKCQVTMSTFCSQLIRVPNTFRPFSTV